MATLRPLTASDTPAAIRVLERAGLAGGALNVERFLRWQPDGAWGRLCDGELIGMVMLLRFGDVGFVGCMAVDPAHQGRGIGRLLLEHAHAEGRRAGVATFLLEATPAGEPLYRSLGYVAEHETVVVTRSGATCASGDPVGRAELAGVLALDRAATGTPRDTMIGGLLDEAVGVVVRDAAGTAAYGLALADRLGPVIARDPGAGRAIIDQLAPACRVWNLPAANAPAIAAATAHGFTEQRRLWRMRLGPPVASRRDWLWALASLGAG